MPTSAVIRSRRARRRSARTAPRTPGSARSSASIDDDDALGLAGRVARSGQPLRRPARAGPAVAPPAGARLPDQRPRQLPALPARLASARPSRSSASPATRIVTPAIAGPRRRPGRLAFLLSVAFVVANGGLILTAAAAPSASPAGSVLGDAETAAPTADAGPDRRRRDADAAPTAVPTATPSPSPTPTATPTPEPDRRRRARRRPPTPTPTPTAPPPPGATASRLALLKPCPDKANCYIYVVRSGDNLYSIANYFGVPLVKTVKAVEPMDRQRPQGRSRPPDPAADQRSASAEPDARPAVGSSEPLATVGHLIAGVRRHPPASDAGRDPRLRNPP